MLQIDWRSPAAYGHTTKIDAAGFAWEYLRRNEDYRCAYEAAIASGGDLPRPKAFEADWGLMFPKRSRRNR